MELAGGELDDRQVHHWPPPYARGSRLAVAPLPYVAAAVDGEALVGLCCHGSNLDRRAEFGKDGNASVHRRAVPELADVVPPPGPHSPRGVDCEAVLCARRDPNEGDPGRHVDRDRAGGACGCSPIAQLPEIVRPPGPGSAV